MLVVRVKIDAEVIWGAILDFSCVDHQRAGRCVTTVALWPAFVVSRLSAASPRRRTSVRSRRARGPWGRVVVIVEGVALHGALVAQRRYEFDLLGMLRRLSERVEHVSARTPDRILERRGYAFFDSAHRAVPR